MGEMKSHYGLAPELSKFNAAFAELRRKAPPIAGQIIGGLVFVGTVLIGTEKPVYAAYTDPGSASLLWQIGVSALIGVGYYFRKFIIRLFGKVNSPNKEDEMGHDG
jgi:hypothetical protein